MAEITHHAITVNGIRMHYAKAGEGERLLLMLHGFPENWYSWRHQLADLSDSFTVVAPDLRGYNDTDAPNWGYELDVLVTDVAELIRGLGYERAIVAAHDWGGAIGWALAISHPHLVERFIPMNIPHPSKMEEAFRTGNTTQMRRSWYIAAFQVPLLPELAMRANNYEFFDRVFRDMAIDKSRFTDEDIAYYKQAAAKPGRLTAMVNYYRQIVQTGPRGLFRGTGMRVTMPTLLIWGEEDLALGKELTYGTGEYVDDLRIHYIPNCSHWVQQEQPEQVNALIREFLADLMPAQERAI